MILETDNSLNQALVQCRDLNKRYGSHHVLRSVSFELSAGQLIGFLGPNGAGKTTTIRILLGLLNPTSGRSTIFGRSSQTDGKQIRAEIGYLPGDVHFYSNLTGIQTLRFFAAARRRNCDQEIARLAKVLDLDLKKTVRKYSTGMRQKLGLIQAFMHQPKLLILDEPTSALDPLIRKTVFAELRSVVEDGRSVLFSSHSLAEVEELCDEVVILRAGEIVEHQTIENLKNKALRRVRITFSSAASVPLKLPPQMNLLDRNGTSLIAAWTGTSSELIGWLDGQEIQDLIVEKPDLSDLFLTYYDEAGGA